MQSHQVPVTPNTPITHVIAIMMENHTFDNFFGTFPGANGVTLRRESNPPRGDIDHSSVALTTALDGGALDDFPSEGQAQYTQADIPNYWAYAQQFGLSDNFYTSMSTSSTPNHIAMIASQSGGDDGTDGNAKQACDSPQNVLIYSKDAAGNHLWSLPLLQYKYPATGTATEWPVMEVLLIRGQLERTSFHSKSLRLTK